MQSYTRLIAQNLSAETCQHHGVDDEYIRLLYQTSPLHDLGKVGIPDAVLLKPGKLTTDEFGIMKTHTLRRRPDAGRGAGAIPQRAVPADGPRNRRDPS